MSKIGTGEGAQAYGHGLYFAESPDVANSYARMGQVLEIDGKPVQNFLQPTEYGDTAQKLYKFQNTMSTANWPLIIGCFIFYFLGGYLFYASLFAAVGSVVNEDPQDAQSLMLPITMPIIFAMVIMTKAVNDPNSSLAVFGSIFPLTSPIVMMARIAHGVPDGVTVIQLIASMVCLVLGFLGTTWLAGKIYRTGILMYGKKATWKTMWQWAFRKN
jgi:ABC-type Na+ efflux pump permease subunit